MARTSNIAGDRREQIIDAALQVFAKKGFAQATNREIAREVGNMVFFAYPPETVYSFRGDMQLSRLHCLKPAKEPTHGTMKRLSRTQRSV